MVDPVIVSSVCSKEAFLTQVYPKRKPALLKGVDIGRATALWTPKYLCERCRGIEVKVHVCPVEQMDFIGRNFVYRCSQLASSRRHDPASQLNLCLQNSPF